MKSKRPYWKSSRNIAQKSTRGILLTIPEPDFQYRRFGVADVADVIVSAIPMDSLKIYLGLLSTGSSCT